MEEINNENYFYITNNLSLFLNEEEKDLDKNLLLFNYFPLYQSLFKFYCTKDYDTLKNSITNKIIKKIEEYYSNQNINILEGIYNIEKNINKILTSKDFDNWLLRKLLLNKEEEVDY